MSLSTHLKRLAVLSMAAVVSLGSMGASAFASPAHHKKPTVKSLDTQITKLQRELTADKAQIAKLKQQVVADAAQIVKLTPKPPAAKTTVMTLSGSGGETSQPFTVPAAWNLNYSYDCSAFGGSGNFQVTIQTSTGGDVFEDQGVNVLGAGGQASSYQPKGGALVLQMNSECSWTVTVVTA